MRRYRKILALLLCCSMLGQTQGELVSAAQLSQTEQMENEQLIVEGQAIADEELGTKQTAFEKESDTKQGQPAFAGESDTEPGDTALESDLNTEQEEVVLSGESATEQETVLPDEEPATEQDEPATEEPTSDRTIMPESWDTEAAGLNYSEMYYEQNWEILEAGKTYQLPSPEIYISEYDDTTLTEEEIRRGFTYSSSNPSVATVSSTGLIKAIGAKSEDGGSTQAVIQATYTDDDGNSISARIYITVFNTINLDKDYFSVYTGQKTKYSLTAAANPAGTVSWKSSNTAIATVNAQGVITPKKAGEVTITATAGGVSDSCYVEVKSPTLALTNKTTMYVGNPASLSGEATPAATITWKSSNKKIATVNKKGVVTPKKTGKVTITAKAHGITKKCVVTVKKPSVSMQTTSTAVFAGSQYQLYATANPYNALKWKSSNKKVASVDKNGVVKAIKSGTATITAYVSGAKATCQITVVKNTYSLSATTKTIMKGHTASIYIKNMPSTEYVYYSVSNGWDIASISTADRICTIKGESKGTMTISAEAMVYADGQIVHWQDTCKIKVLDTGINAQEFSVIKNKTKQLKLIHADNSKTVAKVAWSSSNAKVAAVSESGVVKGKKTGSAKITATVTYTDGKTAAYHSSMCVSNPKLQLSKLLLTQYDSKTIKLKGTNAYSSIRWKSNKKSVATVENGVVTGHATGTATITATVDGKKLTCKVSVTNPMLKEDYSGLAPGGTAQIELSGVTSLSKITYKSSNNAVAKVSSTGKITAVGGGSADITVTADGKKLYYWVEVAPQAAWNACSTGYSIINSSTYSQALRMTSGYYDCSSLVFRAYGLNAALLGGSTSWAPTAAGMATYLEQHGKVISYTGVSVSELQPGDLIFYGNSGNGRYRGIYHVSMYYGRGLRLEKPLYSYYERPNIVMIARPLK